MLTQIKIKMTVILVNKCLSPESIPWSLCGRSTVTKVLKTHVRDLFIWSIIEEGVERHKFIGTVSESDATSKPVLFISVGCYLHINAVAHNSISNSNMGLGVLKLFRLASDKVIDKDHVNIVSLFRNTVQSYSFRSLLSTFGVVQIQNCISASSLLLVTCPT